MYIEPNTTIRILNNVPLDPTYEHTLYWDNASAQATYFSSRAKYTLQRQSYQRVERGYMNVQIRAENLYDCNYLMFNNASFGSKWFYAFITSVEYVNNEVSRIGFVMDVMQTWFFDYQLGECYVEREHAETDEIGDNITEENLPVGDYVYDSLQVTREELSLDENGNLYTVNSKTFWGCVFKQPSYYNSNDAQNYENDFCICIVAPFQVVKLVDHWSIAYDAIPGFYNGLFSGLCYNIFPIDTINDMLSLFDYIAGNGITSLSEARKKEIVAIFMLPKCLITERDIMPKLFSPFCQLSVAKYYNWVGYTPKNNKLYTYPYNSILVRTSDGNEMTYKYEYFDSQNCSFALEAALGVPPQMSVTPEHYCVDGLIHIDGPTSLYRKNYKFSLTVSSFPMCSWSTDTFRAWLAQNAGKILTGNTNAILNYDLQQKGFDARLKALQGSGSISADLVRGVSSVGLEGAALGVASGIASSVLDIGTAAMTMSDGSSGVSRGQLGIGYNEFGYHFYNRRIKNEYAKIIDEYFTRFGYATKLNKVPNRNVRPHWTFTKTVGCLLNGAMPSDDAAKICSIYDRGITFWRNPTEVGNYSLDNSPVSETQEEQNG